MFTLNSDLVDRLLADTMPAFQASCVDTRNLGFGYLYYGLARLMRPRHVVAIGSKAGFAPLCIARALLDNEGVELQEVTHSATTLARPGETATLHFVDPSYSLHRDDPGHSYGIGAWDDAGEVLARWRAFGVEGIATHFKLTSADYLREVSRESEIDLLYVDGDHSYGAIMHDLLGFLPRLSSRSLVLAHDVDPEMPYSDGYRVLRDLPADSYEVTRIPVFPGLAVLRPLGSRPDDRGSAD